MSTRDQLISHGFDATAFTRRMSGLYGRVFQRQANSIVAQLCGRTVLDVGAGSGFLSHAFREAGFHPTGIDVATDSFAFASATYSIDIQEKSIYDTGFPDKAFDSTVMKEVVFHLDFNKCLREVERITKERLIIFQGTTAPAIRFARFLIRHKEHNRRSLTHYRRILAERGWEIRAVSFHDPLALYLSGGVVGPVLCPSWPWLCKLVMNVDRQLNRLFNACRLGPWVCSRFLLVAAPPATALGAAIGDEHHQS